jgi:hypothetical protein
MEGRSSEHPQRERFVPPAQAFYTIAAVLVVFGASAVVSPLFAALGAFVAWRAHDRAALWFGVAATIVCVVLAVLISQY